MKTKFLYVFTATAVVPLQAKASTSFPVDLTSVKKKSRCRLMAAIFGFALMVPAANAHTSAQAVESGNSHSKVLQVGVFKGRKGAFATIQAAVNAAASGDWILVGPGVYREHGAPHAGVLITTPNIHVRGMDRNAVIVDGTNSADKACSSEQAAQVFRSDGGRNGIEVLKVDGVSIENLTACNFLGDADGNGGSQIFWNGGDDSGIIGLGSYHGAYLTASSTFFRSDVPNAGQYGIFISSANGPGTIELAYASNMADASFYVGACADCNAVLRFLHGQNSASAIRAPIPAATSSLRTPSGT